MYAYPYIQHIERLYFLLCIYFFPISQTLHIASLDTIFSAADLSCVEISSKLNIETKFLTSLEMIYEEHDQMSDILNSSDTGVQITSVAGLRPSSDTEVQIASVAGLLYEPSRLIEHLRRNHAVFDIAKCTLDRISFPAQSVSLYPGIIFNL